MHCDYMTDGEQKLLLFKEPAPENEIVCYTVDSAITNAKVRGSVPSVEKTEGGRPPASDATAAAIGWGMLEFVEISGAASVQFLVVARGDEAAVPGERLDVRRRHLRRAPLIQLATAPAVADGVDGRRGDGQRGGGPVESSRQHGRRLRLVLVEIVHPQVVAGFVVAVFTAQL